jgi:DNA polymerase III epsilon subunit-like protein
MKHLKNNIIVAIDIETTGVRPGFHDIIQIAIVPLDNSLKPIGTPFYTNIKPDHPERTEVQALVINGLTLEELNDAPGKERVADELAEWFETLHLSVGGRLIPLSHNFVFENSFLKVWLGCAEMDRIFHYLPRDAMIHALALNDAAALRGEEIPYKSVGLKELCQQFGIINTKPHDALADSIAEAQVYKALLAAR